MEKTHEYSACLKWNGNLGSGTSTYGGYGREYAVAIEGKPDLMGSADPMFRGKSEFHNPEDMFVAAIASCHMLSYLALCARKGVTVISYQDDARGVLEFNADGGGRFTRVTLNPLVTVADAATESLAKSLHDEAHRLCYVACSCSVPIDHHAIVKVAAEQKAPPQ